MEIAEDRVQWWALVLLVLNLQVLLPNHRSIRYLDMTEKTGNWWCFHTILGLCQYFFKRAGAIR
jgi:hypothetical protein